MKVYEPIIEVPYRIAFEPYLNPKIAPRMAKSIVQTSEAIKVDIVFSINQKLMKAQIIRPTADPQVIPIKTDPILTKL